MDYLGGQPQLIHYLPIATTVLSAAFCGVLFRRFDQRGGAHLLWWGGGVFCYGLGTALESAITLTGNSAGLNKAWYIAGALFGGYPLAQGTVYLLLSRRTAHLLSAVTGPILVALSVLVLCSPTDMAALEPHRPGGAALGWQWIRALTPLVNLYAAVFLIGGAGLSAARYARSTDTKHRMIGNILIAVGALLPGIGGGLAKAGMVEALYLGEFLGIILIWSGYGACVRSPAAVPVLAPTEVPATAPVNVSESSQSRCCSGPFSTPDP